MPRLNLLAALAVGCAAPPERDLACDPASAIRSCEDGNDLDCEWARLQERHGDEAAIGTLLTGDAGDLDDSLRRLFGIAADRPMADRRLPDPGPLTYEYEGFPAFEFEVPIDWRADPYGNNSWRLWFQNLGWLHEFYGPEDGDVEAGATVVTDWATSALYEEPPLEFSWGDHALAVRLDRVAHFFDRYVADSTVLDRDVLGAGAQILATHFYALASPLCYTERHNHGVFQDLAILEIVGRYPALRDGPLLREVAEERLLEQVAKSVTDDGIHVENSPHYHALYAELLTRAIATFLDDGRAPPLALVETRDRVMDALVFQLQPNLTLPQFGDTDNEGWQTRLTTMLSQAREQAIGDPAILDALEWVLTRGRTGTQPAETDRVFVTGGYAAFRERWSTTDAADVLTGHFKCSRLSSVHYQPDETSFEVYGHGTELVVSPGVYSYDPEDPLVAYLRDPAAHNLLVVDGAAAETPQPTSLPCVLAHGVEEQLAWLQATRVLPGEPGDASPVRTFAFAKPDTFVVVDHVNAVGRHSYAQHFHLHPDLTSVTVLDDRTVVATRADGTGPTLVLAATERPTEIGLDDGWYFPEKFVAIPTTDVVFQYDRDWDELDLGVVLAVGAPGAEPLVPDAPVFEETGDEATVRWTSGGSARSVTVPRR